MFVDIDHAVSHLCWYLKAHANYMTHKSATETIKLIQKLVTI